MFDNADWSNFLMFNLLIAWFVKIWLHFRFMQRNNPKVGANNFISFITNPENFFLFIKLVFPFWGPANAKRSSDSRRVWISVFAFWIVFGVVCFHLYRNPPAEKTEYIFYDLTK